MAASTSTAPAGGIKSFFLLTQDAANDPLNGHISMDYLTVDPNNRGSVTAPVVIKQNLTTLFNMGAVTPVGVVGPNATLYLFFGGFTATPSVVGRTSANEGAFVAQLGDVDTSGQFFEYKFSAAPFNLIQHNVTCASADVAKAAAQAHATGAPFVLGPYTAGDADTSTVATRKFFVSPFFLVKHFAAIDPDADVVLEFWRIIYPVIEAENKIAECEPLINYFRVAVTQRDATESARQTELTAVEIPTPIGRDDGLHGYLRPLLAMRYRPIFGTATTAATTPGPNRVADSLDKQNAIQEKALNAKLDKQAKDEVDKIIKACGHPGQLEYIMNICNVTRFEDLPDTLMLMLKTSGKAEQDNVLIERMNTICDKNSDLGEPPTVPPGTARKISRTFWHMRTSDLPHTGAAPCNLFVLHGPKDEIEMEREEDRLNEQMNISVGKDEQRELDKSKVYLSTTAGITDLVRKLHILWLALTDDPNHVVTKWLGDYWKTLAANLGMIKKFPTRGSYPKSLIGVHLQVSISREIQKYSEAIHQNKTYTGQLNPRLVVDVVKEDDGSRNWELISSVVPTLERLYPQSMAKLRGGGEFGGLDDDEVTMAGATASAFGRLQMGTPGSVVGGASQGMWNDEVSQIGDVAERNRPAAQSPRLPTVRPAQSAGRRAAPEVAAQRDYNRQVSNNLKMLWVEKRAKCGSTKKAAREGELPPLPKSKVAGHVNDPMCLNYHVMDFCLDNCRERYDHVPYTEEELTDMKEWVNTNATRRAEDDRTRNRRNRRGGGGGRNE